MFNDNDDLNDDFLLGNKNQYIHIYKVKYMCM
jgi:hypothetical protein